VLGELEGNIEKYFGQAEAREMTDIMTESGPIHIGYLLGSSSESRLEVRSPESSKETITQHIASFVPCQFFKVER